MASAYQGPINLYEARKPFAEFWLSLAKKTLILLLFDSQRRLAWTPQKTSLIPLSWSSNWKVATAGLSQDHVMSQPNIVLKNYFCYKVMTTTRQSVIMMSDSSWPLRKTSTYNPFARPESSRYGFRKHKEKIRAPGRLSREKKMYTQHKTLKGSSHAHSLIHKPVQEVPPKSSTYGHAVLAAVVAFQLQEAERKADRVARGSHDRGHAQFVARVFLGKAGARQNAGGVRQKSVTAFHRTNTRIASQKAIEWAITTPYRATYLAKLIRLNTLKHNSNNNNNHGKGLCSSDS